MPIISFLQTRIGRKLAAPLFRAFQNDICKNLAKYGLRHEDMIRVGEMGRVGAQSVALLPDHAQQARIRRYTRAQDLANKHMTLTTEQQKMQQPLKQELSIIIEHLQQRDLERRTYK